VEGEELAVEVDIIIISAKLLRILLSTTSNLGMMQGQFHLHRQQVLAL
jgi:hypothetical protein